MSAQHTPGPWTAEYCCYTDSETTAVGEGSFQILDGPDSRTAAVLCTRLRWPERAREMEANARLIAAAPELLQSCRMLLQWIDVEAAHFGAAIPDDYILLPARAAVAKAMGAE